VLILAVGIYLEVWPGSGTHRCNPWILVSLAALVVMGVLGSAVSARRLAAIEKAVVEETGGALPPALQRQIADPGLLIAVQSAGMLGLGIVFLMTARPDLIGSLMTVAVAIVLGIVSVQFWRPAEAKALAQETAGRL
jgi:hypothetical protein